MSHTFIKAATQADNNAHVNIVSVLSTRSLIYLSTIESGTVSHFGTAAVLLEQLTLPNLIVKTMRRSSLHPNWIAAFR
jgi:hypothetical protein